MALELKGRSMKSDPGVDGKIIIKVNADGSTNLSRRLVQQISDKLTILFPRTAFGILNEGKWRDIESEAPRLPRKPLGLRTGYTPTKSSEAKEVEGTEGGGGRTTKARGSTKTVLEAVSEFAAEEAMSMYETDRIIYHEELKLFVRDKKDYFEEKIKMHAIIHAMLSTEAIEKVEKTENYEDEIAKPRDGEKLWDCIRKVLIIGLVGPSQEVTRRLAEKRWEQVIHKNKSETLTDFKERYLDTYNRYIAAGGTRLDEVALAKRFMWTVDIDMYAEAVSSILNDEANAKPMPDTVEKMCSRIRMHVNLRPGKATAGGNFQVSGEDTLAHVYAAVSKGNDDSDTDSEHSGKRNNKKSRKKSEKSESGKSESGKSESGNNSKGKCHECGEEGHYASDCELRKELNKLRKAYKKKKKKTEEDSEFVESVKSVVQELKCRPKSVTSAFAWADSIDVDDYACF
jgi:hypothetical protein